MGFSINFHHGGFFAQKPTLRYEGGTVTFSPYCDEDRMSLLELHSCVKRLGYMGCKGLWYIVPGFQIAEGLKLLTDDGAVMEMCSLLDNTQTVDIFLEHDVDVPEVIQPQLIEESPGSPQRRRRKDLHDPTPIPQNFSKQKTTITYSKRRQIGRDKKKCKGSGGH